MPTWKDFKKKYRLQYYEPDGTISEDQKIKNEEKVNENARLFKIIVLTFIVSALILFASLIVMHFLQLSKKDKDTVFLFISTITSFVFLSIVIPKLKSFCNKIMHKNVEYDTSDMDGIQYEYYVAERLKSIGYYNVRVTKGSGDHGADILATSPRGKTCAIQCKHYAGKVGNKAVQEAYSAAGYYGCREAIVITNSVFTKQAIQDANRLGVKLIQRF